VHLLHLKKETNILMRFFLGGSSIEEKGKNAYLLLDFC
jgi:hypothetical protein